MSALTGVRHGLLRVEAAWWMSRTFLSNLATWAAVIGWAVADPHLGSWGRMLALVVGIIALNGAMFIVNDILDADGDVVTAPYLPLPSGLLSLRQAWVAMGAGLLIAVVCVAEAGRTSGRLAVAAGLLVLGVILSAAYSKVKDFGIWGSLTVALPQSVPAAAAWVLAGGGPTDQALLVLAYLLLASVSNNILAALRDVEKDPEAGYRTLAVRIGAPGAFRAAAFTGFAALVPVAVLAVIRPGWWGLAFAGAGAVIHLFCYPRLLANFADPERGRTQRLADQRLWKLGEYVKHSSVIAAFNPIAGLVAGVVLYACLRGGYRVYNARLVRGGIRRSLLGPAPVEGEPADRQPTGRT
jgi:4-hydroxybenzoate polyprenyltransferase